MVNTVERTEPVTLQARLELARHRGTNDTTNDTSDTEPSVNGTAAGPGDADPVRLFRHLETSGHFHRDSGFGRMFHPGRLSLREKRPTNSLHVVIHHDHISAHVDLVSPLHLRPARTHGYSIRRTVAHNLAGMAQDLLRLLRGRQGDHRSELDCRWVWDAPNPAPDPKDLLDPAVSAWSLQLEARVSGTLEEPQLLRALTAVLGPRPANHAMLKVVNCPDDSSLDAARSELYAAPVPVLAWPPVRAQLAQHPGGDVLMLNVNHAASDGFGASSDSGVDRPGVRR